MKFYMTIFWSLVIVAAVTLLNQYFWGFETGRSVCALSLIVLITAVRVRKDSIARFNLWT